MVVVYSTGSRYNAAIFDIKSNQWIERGLFEMLNQWLGWLGWVGLG
jgi:hypothetical protein